MTPPIPVFVGPSLAPAFRPSDPRFVWLPPALAGDIAALRHRPPERLCLIDGFFHSCPAPWHKELLLLMSLGTIVYGAASMGALRAAELEPFGMIGIGRIFEAYRRGRLSGADEVALIHATEPLDWAPLTVPMVERRATLAAACRAGILTTATARQVREIARAIHFTDRDWPRIAATCLGAGLGSRAMYERLELLHVPLKRIDALACLDAARAPSPPGQHLPDVPLTCFIEDLLADYAPSSAALQAFLDRPEEPFAGVAG